MTLMVRDEADIVGAMLTHHRDQGVDHVVVTDNASIDGTLDVLEFFEREGFVTLWHDPVHRKQQGQAVTRMARYAHTELGADWVINADADEFWVARDSGQTVRDVFERLPSELVVFHTPVVNLTGAPARAGSGLHRLTLRDQREPERLRDSGIPFHPTPNAVHRGHAAVVISQGNHRAAAPGWPDGRVLQELEVLHLPWRSWKQYEYKVRVSGEAYARNPELAPSPRHHGMLDYRRMNEGWLEAAYVAKHPSGDEAAAGLADGSFVREDRLGQLIGDTTPGIEPDVVYESGTLEELRSEGRRIRRVEMRGEVEVSRIQAFHDLAVSQRDDAERRLETMTRTLEDLRSRALIRAAWRIDEGARRRLASLARGIRRLRRRTSQGAE